MIAVEYPIASLAGLYAMIRPDVTRVLFSESSKVPLNSMISHDVSRHIAASLGLNSQSFHQKLVAACVSMYIYLSRDTYPIISQWNIGYSDSFEPVLNQHLGSHRTTQRPDPDPSASLQHPKIVPTLSGRRRTRLCAGQSSWGCGGHSTSVLWSSASYVAWVMVVPEFLGILRIPVALGYRKTPRMAIHHKGCKIPTVDLPWTGPRNFDPQGPRKTKQLRPSWNNAQSTCPYTRLYPVDVLIIFTSSLYLHYIPMTSSLNPHCVSVTSLVYIRYIYPNCASHFHQWSFYHISPITSATYVAEIFIAKSISMRCPWITGSTITLQWSNMVCWKWSYSVRYDFSISKPPYLVQGYPCHVWWHLGYQLIVAYIPHKIPIQLGFEWRFNVHDIPMKSPLKSPHCCLSHEFPRTSPWIARPPKVVPTRDVAPWPTTRGDCGKHHALRPRSLS